MNSTTANLAAAYFLDDVPGATIPASRLYAIIQRVDARRPLTVIQQDFLRKLGYDALLQLALGELDTEAFSKISQVEQVSRLMARVAAEEAEATMRSLRDEATERNNKVAFAKREKQLENRRLRDRFGQGYIEPAHYGRVMWILLSVAHGKPIDTDDILWLGSSGSDYWTEELRRAHHSNKATAYTEAWHRTGDVWEAVSACSHWRKAGCSETGITIAEEALSRSTDPKRRSAVLTTRGGALRDP